MKGKFIIYRCNKCGCIFGVHKKFVKHTEEEGKYISCPIFGKHKDINVIDLKELMEECKAVNI